MAAPAAERDADRHDRRPHGRRHGRPHFRRSDRRLGRWRDGARAFIGRRAATCRTTICRARRSADAILTPAQARQDPADLLEIARVVGPRREVELAAAAAEMRYRIVPAARRGEGGEGLRIVAARRTLQAMEQHQQRLRAGGRCIEEVDVDEVPVRRGPALAPEVRQRAVGAPRIERRPYRLQVAARQPAGRDVVHQCRVCGISLAPPGSWALPGLAWWATMRQPWAVRW